MAIILGKNAFDRDLFDCQGYDEHPASTIEETNQRVTHG